MKQYRYLRDNPPTLEVVKEPKEVIIYTVSVMCDNKHTIRFSKNENGEFKMSGMGFALSNWQMKHRQFEIEWKADEGKWNEVFTMVNSGTEAIEKVISR